MADKQAKPAAQRRHETQVMQQVPNPKLMLVFTLDGVTAEPLLTYQNTQVRAPLGKTRSAPSEQARGAESAAVRHERAAMQSARAQQPHLARHEEEVARMARQMGGSREEKSPVIARGKEREQ